MSEDRNDMTIGEMPTRAPKGPQPVMLAGRYRALRRLGEGGMGSVWLAEDTKLDDRKVAIKVLPAVLAGRKAACRQVKQEALLAMRLAHPNIATVRAFEEEEGQPFLVMDYIDGEGLDDILDNKGRLSETETLKLLAPVAAALDYAHSQGVVHRDVKPGNVLVRKDGTPFVLDFGIAREIQETMTRVTGKFSSGTLTYMSPEQLHGRAPKPAQDVYSFATMAYECLNGRPPFRHGRVEYQIDNDLPEPLRETVASEALRVGIMAGLAKDPKNRPDSCVGVLGLGEAAKRARKEREVEEAARRQSEEVRLAQEPADAECRKQPKKPEAGGAIRRQAEAEVQQTAGDAGSRVPAAVRNRMPRDRWWWAVAVAAVTVLLVLPWWLMRQGELEKWGNIRDKACELAKGYHYSQALNELDTIPSDSWKQWFLGLHWDEYSKDFRTPWNKLKGIERKLKEAISVEQAARKGLAEVERQKKTYEGSKEKAREEWAAYEKDRREAADLLATFKMDDARIPVQVRTETSIKKDWNELPEVFFRAADHWKQAATHLNEACQKIDRIENPSLQERRRSLLATNPGGGATARDRAVAAESKLKTHEWETEALNIGRKYAWNQWTEYANYRQQADDFMESIVYDEDGWPYRKTEAGTQPLSLDSGELKKLAKDYRDAENLWTKALEARQSACRIMRGALVDDRGKLSRACQQERAEEKHLEDLLQDSRYEDVQKSPQTVTVWNEFVDLYEKAEQLKREIPTINAGLPVPTPVVLETNTLGNLCGKVNEVSDLWRQARQKLAEAYRIIDQANNAKSDEANEPPTQETPVESPPTLKRWWRKHVSQVGLENASQNHQPVWPEGR